MTYVIAAPRRASHRRQPSGMFPGVRSAYGGGLIDIAYQTTSERGRAWTTFGTAPTNNVGPYGEQIDATAAFGGVYYTPSNVNTGATEAFLFYGTVTEYTGAYAGLLTIADATGSAASLALQRDSVGTSWDLRTSVGVAATTATDPILNAGPVCVLLTGSPEGSRVWVNGEVFLSAASSGSVLTGSRAILFGERTGSASFACKGTSALRAFWVGRGFSDGEARVISRNPWQILAPRRSQVFYTDGAAAAAGNPWHHYARLRRAA